MKDEKPLIVWDSLTGVEEAKRYDWKHFVQMMLVIGFSLGSYYGLFKLAQFLSPISRLWP
jgi:hypothetical protein